MINNYKEIITNNKNIAESFNILCCADLNYLTYVGVLITSINKHNSHHNITYNIISDEYSTESLNKLQELATTLKINIKLYIIDKSKAENAIGNFQYTGWHFSMFYRLFALQYFQSQLNKILYLDADIICYNDIRELIEKDISNYALAGVLDNKATQLTSIKSNQIQELKNNYINTGVLLVNLQLWHKFDLHTKIMQYFHDNQRSPFPDQDAINVATIHNKLLLDKSFNFMTGYNRQIIEKIPSDQTTNTIKIPENRVFIHYTGVIKPWFEFYGQKNRILYRSIYESSIYKDTPYTQARCLRDLKFKYKYEFAQRYYLQFLYTFTKLKYLQINGKTMKDKI